MQDIEQAFAAAVANARGNAKIAATAGHPLNASDQVAGALAELWERGRAAGLSADAVQAVADRYVVWDGDNPWPREMPANVVPFRR
jgi:hypothetical protein